MKMKKGFRAILKVGNVKASTLNKKKFRDTLGFTKENVPQCERVIPMHFSGGISNQKSTISSVPKLFVDLLPATERGSNYYKKENYLLIIIIIIKSCF